MEPPEYILLQQSSTHFNQFSHIYFAFQLIILQLFRNTSTSNHGNPSLTRFADFVDRYRILVSGIAPSHVVDCRKMSTEICKQVLGNADFQLGKTKVFLKVGILSKLLNQMVLLKDLATFVLFLYIKLFILILINDNLIKSHLWFKYIHWLSNNNNNLYKSLSIILRLYIIGFDNVSVDLIIYQWIKFCSTP